MTSGMWQREALSASRGRVGSPMGHEPGHEKKTGWQGPRTWFQPQWDLQNIEILTNSFEKEGGFLTVQRRVGSFLVSRPWSGGLATHAQLVTATQNRHHYSSKFVSSSSLGGSAITLLIILHKIIQKHKQILLPEIARFKRNLAVTENSNVFAAGMVRPQSQSLVA